MILALPIAADGVGDTSQNWRKPTVSEGTRGIPEKMFFKVEVHRLTLTTEDQKRELFEDADEALLQAFNSGKLVYDHTNIRIADPNFLKGTRASRRQVI